MTNLWPRDHSFTAADCPYDAWTAWGSFIMDSVEWARGYLIDADVDGAPIIHGTNGSKPNSVCGMLWCGNQLEDVVVEGIFSLRTDFAAATTIQTNLAAVFVRLQGGSMAVASDPNFEPWENPSGYSMALRGDAAGGTFRFDLSRWNSGVETIIGTTNPVPITVVGDSVFDGSKPFTLRLRAVTNGSGNVELNGQLKNFSNSNGVTIPGGTVLFGQIDSSPSRVTGAGFSGFAMGSDESKTLLPGLFGFPINVASKSNRFTIWEDGAADATVDEDWVRAAQFTEPRLEVTDDLGNVGVCLQARYTWDLHGSSNGFVAKFLTAGGAPDSARFVDVSSPERRYVCTSQRPPTSATVQHPTVEFQFDDPSDHAFGVIARQSGTPLSSLGSWSTTRGYLCVVDQGLQKVIVSRLPGGISELADFENPMGEYIPTPAITTGTRYTVGLRARPVNASIPDGPQIVELFWNGLQVPLTFTGTIGGFSSDSGGGIIDATSARVVTGNEAICYIGRTSNDDLSLFAFTEGDLGTVELLPQDQASVSFGDEGASEATLDFWDVQIVAPVATELGWQVHRQEFESGHTLARALQSTERRAWRRLETAPLDTTQKDALVAFWNARRGAEGAFTWTNPEDQVAYKVHFMPDSFEVEELFSGGDGIWVCRFGLEELR